MTEASKFDREFLRLGLTLAAKSEVDHLLFISDSPIDPADLRGRKCRKKLIYAVTLDAIALELKAKKDRALVIPAASNASKSTTHRSLPASTPQIRVISRVRY